MKYDGHVKLTRAAIDQLQANCPDASACNTPLFDTTFRIWMGDSEASNALDNYSAAFVNYVGYSLMPEFILRVRLPDAVAFVDLDEMWTHDDPLGQRYHFMRSVNETEIEAHRNGCRFIKRHTANWVNAAKEDIRRTTSPATRGAEMRSEHYMAELALALHSLQDSFSPGHTERDASCYTSMMSPIQTIFVYANQDHDDHAEHDYGSGSPNQVWGRAAVAASVDLFRLGILSIPAPGCGLTGWDAFERMWLSQNI